MTLAHSISAATSRSSAGLVPARRRRAASASRPTLESSTVGGRPPTVRGQKWLSWRSAAEWNVRACTRSSPAPRPASWCTRARSSPAARVVNVSASTWPGSTTPVRAA